MSSPLGLRSPVEELSHWMRNSVSHFSASRTSLKVYSCLLSSLRRLRWGCVGGVQATISHAKLTRIFTEISRGVDKRLWTVEAYLQER